MQRTAEAVTTRTTADIVFDQLHDDISTLRLLPGARISEADIARQLGVSRQPVRDAFNRLGNLGLLSIRPQRATEVRGFSMSAIQNARFVRLAVELEVVTRACRVWTEAHARALLANIELQQQTLDRGEMSAFHDLDYTFHQLICEFSGYPLAFNTIENCKRSVDRLCLLSLQKAYEGKAVIEDHEAIASALVKRSARAARTAVEHHLSRLDTSIEDIHAVHADYFE